MSRRRALSVDARVVQPMLPAVVSTPMLLDKMDAPAAFGPM